MLLDIIIIMRLIAALSGGVDSAVAALIAKQNGHELFGVHLNFAGKNKYNFCATKDDALDAKKVANKLKIPYDLWDYSANFEQYVENYFIKSYSQNRTPNPCIRCNQTIKFGYFLVQAKKLGFDGILTGHWANIDSSGLIARAKNILKDQTYVLAGVGQKVSKYIVTPLGNYKNKNEIRELGKANGLLVHRKKESFDICFVDNLKNYLTNAIGKKPGKIIDQKTMKTIKTHNGSYIYTIGQRRGLALGNYDGSGEKKYVSKLENSTVYVNNISAIKVVKFGVSKLIFYNTQYKLNNLLVQIRAHCMPLKCSLELINKTSGIVKLQEKAFYGVNSGQSAVFYNNNIVVAHGIIEI
jgi:tRNA-specific 2-thiouridylase